MTETYDDSVIVHRRSSVNSLSLVIIALALVPFVMNGGVGTWIIVGGIWTLIAGVLVRRYRAHGRRDGDVPPWAV